MRDGSDNPYDGVAGPYGAVRPGYPSEVFAAIESYADLHAPPRVLGIGAGTGQARRQMAALGWIIDAIENLGVGGPQSSISTQRRLGGW